MGSVVLAEPLPHQLEVLRRGAGIAIVVCGRRWGKTTAGPLATVEGHGPRTSGFQGALEGGTIWWVAPLIATFGSLPDRRMLVLDVDRARREGPDLVPAMRRAVSKWSLSAIWVEQVAFQLALIQEARRAGLPVRHGRPPGGIHPPGSHPAAAVSAYRVTRKTGRPLTPVLARPPTRDFESEVLAFPNRVHDDQVDVLAYAVRLLDSGQAGDSFRLFREGGSASSPIGAGTAATSGDDAGDSRRGGLPGERSRGAAHA